MTKDRPIIPPLIPILALALGLRLLILAANAVPFNSDEAVVALMARHTLAGDWTPFFYGQSYMGSLDATLVAAGFALLGESVLTIRLVQTVLYLAVVASTYWLSLRLYRQRALAALAALLLAIPTVLVSTYTSATLGGYNEVLLLGNLVLLLGHAAATDLPDDPRIWLALGLAGGLGFWTSALIGVYLLPVVVLLAGRLLRPPAGARRPRWHLIALAALAFLLGSAPWWWQNLTHQWAGLDFVLGGTEQSGIGIQSVPLSTRLAGFALFGLPALLGMRFPWSADYIVLPLAVPVLMLALAALGYALAEWRRERHPGRGLLLGVALSFALVFIFSRFGTDATGRYFLPLAPVLAIWSAALLVRLRAERPPLAWLALLLLLAFNLYGNGLALANNPPGLTTQFDPSNRFDNRYDDTLIAFLQANDLTRGYSNYFVAFRIAFLSGEAIQLSSQLPYKPDLSYNPADERYPPYRAAVDEAERVVYITSIHPTLDDLLADKLAAAGVRCSETTIGPYHLFYDLSRKVTPQELGLGTPQ